MSEPSIELRCAACSWRTVCGPDGAQRYLRQAGMLRRTSEIDRALLMELLTGALLRIQCPECGTSGLELSPHDDGEWHDAVLCEACRKPIPPERIEAIPGVTRCTACQHDEESGTTETEPEYCPKCGAPLVLRTSSGAGTTRYKLFCTGNPSCRL